MIGAKLPLPAKKAVYTAISSAVEKSSVTIIFLRLTLSARIPPNGESRMVGIMETARIPPNTAADPVLSSTNKERENLKMEFPNKDIIWPTTKMVKSLVNKALFFIIFLLCYNTDGWYVSWQEKSL